MDYQIAGKCERCGQRVILTLSHSWHNDRFFLKDDGHDERCLERTLGIKKRRPAKRKVKK